MHVCTLNYNNSRRVISTITIFDGLIIGHGFHKVCVVV